VTLRYGYDRPDYYTAAVCLRGHVETSVIELQKSAIPSHCQECGAPIIVACPACNATIRGMASHGISANYEPPKFCGCGNPFPWAPDEAIAYHIENQLAADKLPDAERRDLDKKLEVLLNRDADSKKRAMALHAFMKMAPRAYALAEVALRAYITSDIQTHMK